MRKKTISGKLPEIIFSSSDILTTQQIKKLVKEGLLKKLLPKVYTANMLESETISQ